ncbi:MAG: hypothetical protein IKJ30_03310 [Bacilli bacterium]|nr:hypothetical protein [Bacilli bacterium]
MKKNGLKVLSLSILLSTLCIAGCSCDNGKPNVAEITDADILSGLTDDASDLSLLDIYNAMIANDVGSKAAADKLVDIVGSTVLDLEKDPWKTKYNTMVEEKLEELKNSDEYQVNGKFDEELFVLAMKKDGYNVTKDDYSDLINRKFKVEIISTLLKQKYIKDVTLKDSKNVVNTKKIRDVEYLTVSSSIESDYDDYTVDNNGEEEKVEINVRNFMRGIRDEIAAAVTNSTIEDIDFTDYADRLKEELKAAVNGEYQKIIDGAKDYSQELAAEYTANYTRTLEEGLKEKIKAVEDLEFNFDKVISSDSENASVVSTTITNRLLNLSNPENETKRAIKIGDWYYLVSANAGATVDANDVLLTETSDSGSYTYSIVRFKVINADNYSANENDVIEILAGSSTLATGAVSHYLEQYKNTITIHDDAVNEYLKKLYPDVFTD